MNAGASIGVIIGFLSGIITARIVFTIAKKPARDWASVTALYAQIVSVPTFMFTGNWASSKLLEKRWDALFDSYVRWLAISFFVLVLVPTILWMVREVKNQSSPAAKPKAGAV